MTEILSIIGAKVLIRVIKDDKTDKTPSGLIIMRSEGNSAKLQGEVLMLGDIPGDADKLGIEIGSVVLCNVGVGVPVVHKDEPALILHYNEIFAVLKKQ